MHTGNVGLALPVFMIVSTLAAWGEVPTAVGMGLNGANRATMDGAPLTELSEQTAMTEMTLPVVVNGTIQAVVIRNEEGGAIRELAINELLDHIEAMTGARLPVVDANTWDRESEQTAIIVGRGALLDEIGVDLGDLPWEGYRILSLPERHYLVLAGRDRGNPWSTAHPRNRVQEFGTLYAVYDLLEHWGVRWLFPGVRGTVIPLCVTLEVPPIDRVAGPDFRRRNLWTAAEEPFDRLSDAASPQRAARLWALRCRAGNSMGEYATGHHSPNWWTLWSESHPEYLGLFQGQRGWLKRPERSKLCASNPEMAQAVAALAIAAFHNGRLSYSICEQDGSPGYCTCAECRALDLPLTGETPYAGQDFGTPGVTPLTDRYIGFWNQVAEYVEAAFPDDPDHYLGIYLYSYMSDLPRREQSLHPRLRAVYVNNGQIEPDELRRRIAGWNLLTPHPITLYVPPMFGAWPLWDYGQLTLPVLTLNNVHEGIRFCREQGVAGIQGSFNFAANNVGSHGVLAYAHARWLWDADITAGETLDDFTRHAFGPAAGTMMGYFQAIEQQQNRFPLPFVPRENAGYENWIEHHMNVFEPGFVAALRSQIDNALSQAQTEPDRERVQIFHQNLVFTTAQLDLERTWRVFTTNGPKADITSVLAAYRTCEKLYADLWPENKPAQPLFQRGAAAKAVLDHRMSHKSLTARMAVVDFNGTNRYLTGSAWPGLPNQAIVDSAGSRVYGSAGSTRTWCYDFDAAVNPAGTYLANGGPQYCATFEQQISKGDYTNHPVESLNKYLSSTPPAADQLQFWGRKRITEEDPKVDITLLLFFKLAPLETGSLAQGDSIRVNATTQGSSRHRKLAVYNSGVWYLSQNNFTLGAATTNLHQEMWAPWDPSGAPLAALPSEYTTPGSDLTAITALGLVFSYNRSTIGGAPRIGLTEYQADLSVRRELLTMTSRWDTVRYEATLYPEESETPTWGQAYSAGTRQIEDGMLTVNTTGTDGRHYYYKSSLDPTLDPAGNGYLVTWRMALPANETTIRYRDRADAAFMMSIAEWDSTAATSHVYYVAIDNECLATAYQASASLHATNLLFSALPGFSVREQHEYTVWRDLTGLRIYVDGVLRSEDRNFNPTNPLNYTMLAFGDQGTSFDHAFTLDYLRAGAAIIPPPPGTMFILN